MSVWFSPWLSRAPQLLLLAPSSPPSSPGLQRTPSGSPAPTAPWITLCVSSPVIIRIWVGHLFPVGSMNYTTILYTHQQYRRAPIPYCASCLSIVSVFLCKFDFCIKKGKYSLCPIVFAFLRLPMKLIPSKCLFTLFSFENQSCHLSIPLLTSWHFPNSLNTLYIYLLNLNGNVL
jgi:hypothetical protein